MDYEQLLPLEIIKEYAKVDSDAVASDALLQMFREVAFATYTAFTGEDLTSYKDCVEAVTLKKFPYSSIPSNQDVKVKNIITSPHVLVSIDGRLIPMKSIPYTKIFKFELDCRSCSLGNVFSINETVQVKYESYIQNQSKITSTVKIGLCMVITYLIYHRGDSDSKDLKNLAYASKASMVWSKSYI